LIQPIGRISPLAPAASASARCSVTLCAMSGAYARAMAACRAGCELRQYCHRNGSSLGRSPRW